MFRRTPCSTLFLQAIDGKSGRYTNWINPLSLDYCKLESFLNVKMDSARNLNYPTLKKRNALSDHEYVKVDYFQLLFLNSDSETRKKMSELNTF